MQLFRLALALALIGLVGTARAADENDPHKQPVKVVADQRLAVTGAAGSGALPLYVTGDWDKPSPDVTRAVLVFHGLLRDADVYLKSGEAALAEAGDAGKGTLLIVPQFLADRDIAPHDLPADTLRWGQESWMGGEPAHGPAPLSSFEAIRRDSGPSGRPHPVPESEDRRGRRPFRRRPGRRTLCRGRQGRSRAYGQGCPCALCRGEPVILCLFQPDRPLPSGGTGPFAGALACPAFNHWKYGFEGVPPYVAGADISALESRFVTRDVIYLLGTADTNPNHPALDKSCEGEAEGPYRLARGHAFFAYLQARHPTGLVHHLWEVPGVGHDGGKMLGSACGLAALFDKPGCAAN